MSSGYIKPIKCVSVVSYVSKRVSYVSGDCIDPIVGK